MIRGVIQDLSLLIGFAGVKQVPCVCVCVCVCGVYFSRTYCKAVCGGGEGCVGLPEDCQDEIRNKVCGVWRRRGGMCGSFSRALGLGAQTGDMVRVRRRRLTMLVLMHDIDSFTPSPSLPLPPSPFPFSFPPRSRLASTSFTALA
jgi:hypothetical protein